MLFPLRRVGGAPPLLCAFALLLCGLFGKPAHAARPMVTDDARIVEPKSCQLETWLQYRLGDMEYWALPGCNFTGNLEITFGGALTKGFRQPTLLTDILFQGKTMFKTLEPNSWSLGLALGNLRRPRVHSDRSPVGDFYLYMPASFAFFEELLVVHFNGGWRYEKARRGHHLRWGVGFELQLSEHSWLMAEAFSEDSSGAFFQVGLRLWLVPERVQVDATLGDHLEKSRAQERWFSVGLRLMSPAW